MGYVTNARQRLTTKAVSANGPKIVKVLKLRSSETFAEDRQIVSLL